MEKEFKYEVVDKFIKDGFFGRKYFVVLKIDLLDPSVQTIRFTENDYYTVLNEGLITMVQKSDGYWYIWRDNN